MSCRAPLLVAALLLSIAGWSCSGDDKPSSAVAGAGGATTGGSAGDGGAGGQAGGDGGSGGTSATGGAGGGSTTLGGPFRLGVNNGYRNSAWGDVDLAQLDVRAGCNSLRVSLPEQHLAKWGWTIEVSDMQAYAALGLHDHVAFLTAPTQEHSAAPAGTPDWQLAWYLPKNLYEPITDNQGHVNPDNYWADYVFRTVDAYKTWVKVWEIWNEPDWVSDWQVTQTWTTSPPQASDLPRFNGTIFDYIRMLRVSREAARLADPEARIATGGLGYSSFLSAILRYTDNPADGSATAEYPERGGAYFDVLSFHHYPLYTAGNSEAGVDGYLAHRDEMAQVLSDAGVAGKTFVTTESGAPHEAIANWPSGPAYARNYLLKVMTLANAAGVSGLDWFALNDTADASDLSDPYEHMGLYEDILSLATTDEAVLTDTGIAYGTLGTLLADARFDGDETAALALPGGVRGAAFRLAQDTPAYVLWAVPQGAGEDAQASYTLPTTRPFARYEWDAEKTGASTLMSPVGGSLEVALTGSPVFLVAQ